MDARQLSYFLAVVDQGGFGRAAEHLRVAQPSLSQSIATLERELGVQLFHRVGRGVVLSDPGAELVGPARRVLRELEAARAAVRSTRELLQGTVHVSAMPSPGIEPLSTVLAAFAREHPAIVVRVDGAFAPEDVVHAVRSGVADVGLLGVPGPVRHAGLELLPLGEQPLVLVSPPGDELPDVDAVRLADLPGLRLVVSPRGTLMRQLVDDALAAGADARVVAEVAHRTSILSLVLAGVGHAVLPSPWTRLAEASGARVRGIEPRARLHVGLLHRSGTLSPAAAAFLAAARTAAGEDRGLDP